MSLKPDLLYSWLPAHIRTRDREEGEPLRALMAVLEESNSQLHDDVGRLYLNWFIETCQEWAVPYIGDLIGMARLKAMNPRAYTLRAYVANAIALRRRKGTPAALEQVAQDVTGWHASVLEMFQCVSTTQHIQHPRVHSLRTPSLGLANEMDRLYGPFEQVCRTLDVRGKSGRYNLQTVSLFLWRLRAWPVTLAPAARHPPATSGGAPWYHFSQLGRDLPLFNIPQTKLEPASLAQEHHLPARLRRSALFQELESRRQAEVDGIQSIPAWFGAQPPFRIYKRDITSGVLEEVSSSTILIADLSRCGASGWSRPPSQHTYYSPTGRVEQKRIAAVVDPELGRLVFTAGNEPSSSQEVLVSYHYGFSGEVGGGPYGRHAELPNRESFSRYRVRRDGQEEQVADSLQEVQQWIDGGASTPGAIIEIRDSFVYALPEGGMTLQVAEGKHLEIRAADRQRPVVDLAGGLTVRLARNASLTLNGLWMHSGDIVVQVDPSGPTAISLIHCTLVPGTEGHSGAKLKIESSGTETPLSVRCTVRRSIVGALEMGTLGAGCALDIEESIVDHRTGIAIDHGGLLRTRASTILGKTQVEVLELASDVLFTGTVMSRRSQNGCIRFSYLPPGSEVPPRFHCQPDIPEGADTITHEAILHHISPRFASTQYGQPGYCQLASDLPDELLRGASDEGEVGVFNHLEQSQRRLNLQTALSEYLRLGLEAGLIFVT
jgi:hypothetical protein